MKTLNAMLTAEKTEEDTFELSTTETTANEQDEIGLIEPTENVLIIGGKRIQATPQEMIPILEAFEKLTRFLKNNGRGALSKILAKAENEHQAAFRSIPPLPPVPPNKVRELVAKLALTKIPLPTIPPRGAVVAAPASNAKEGAPRSKVGEMAKQYAQKVEAAQRGKAIPPIKAAKEDKNKKDGKDADKKSGQRPGTPGVGG